MGAPNVTVTQRWPTTPVEQFTAVAWSSLVQGDCGQFENCMHVDAHTDACWWICPCCGRATLPVDPRDGEPSEAHGHAPARYTGTERSWRVNPGTLHLLCGECHAKLPQPSEVQP